jgi:RimJ/RimL family protein N-acetyltransferase
MIRYGIERGLERIAASADAPNRASIRVMEKAGMVYEKTVRHGAGDTVYYVVPPGMERG